MIIETKVAAASAGGGIAAVAATVAMDYLYKQPIPQSAVEVLLVYIVAQGGAFIAGYVAKHTHRPDLAATEVLPPTGSPSMADTGPTSPEGGPPDAVLTEAQAGQVQAAIDAAVAAIPPAAPTPVVVPVTVTAPPAPAWDALPPPAPAPAPAPPVPQAGATAAMV